MKPKVKKFFNKVVAAALSVTMFVGIAEIGVGTSVVNAVDVVSNGNSSGISTNNDISINSTTDEFCQQISLGERHSGTITKNGDLYMWGSNIHGERGDGTTNDSPTPKKIMSNVAAVSLGGYHSGAITKNGDLYMWGSNLYGECGDGTTNDSPTPKKIMSNVAAVSLGGSHSGAITTNGDLYMWGYNYYGQLGNGTTINSSTPKKIMSNVVAVSLGEFHSGAITKSGDLYMWGDNYVGQLGDGTEYDFHIPKKILSNIVEVSLGGNHSGAITRNNDLYMWGYNGDGQLGNGTTNGSYTPKKIMSNVAAVSLGSYCYSGAITKNGDLYMWGYNRDGQLGDGTTTNKYTPTLISNNWSQTGDNDMGHSNICQYNGHTYQIFDEGISWSEAKSKCEELGGHLATITTGEEEDAIYNLIQFGTKYYYWLGGTDEDEEGNWKWITGETWDYQNWLSGEPDNCSGVDGNAENYLSIEREGWNDLQIEGDYYGTNSIENSGFICEWETQNISSILKFGADRFTFGEDISGSVGSTVDALVVYKSMESNIDSLAITSSNPDIVEIGTIKNDVGDYLISENEHKATVPLKLKAEGKAIITIVSPEGISTSVDVTCNKSSYEIKLFSPYPELIVGKGNQIKVAVQLKNNGEVVDGGTAYTFVSSNNNIVSLTNIRNESDGTYFCIDGKNEGEAIITITENNTGSILNCRVVVQNGILTYNAEALPKYYDFDEEYNGYIGGMYIDEFESVEKDENTLNVSFNVYNTTNIVGVVDVYDSEGNIIKCEQIKRFDGGFTTSIADTLISGYELIKDIATGDILTYKQNSYSQWTPITVEVPKGGRIEITNDPLYSNTCAVYNYSEFITQSILMFGDVAEIKAEKSKEVSEIVGKNIVDKFLKEYISAFKGEKVNEKVAELGAKVIEKLKEKSVEKIMESSITGQLASFVDDGKVIFEECDIDLDDFIISSAASIGISIAESSLIKAMGPFGDVLNGMFKFSEYGSYSCFLVDLLKTHENHVFRVYFNDKQGNLYNNGVSIKSENGTVDLSELNYVMHSVVLSNKEDLEGKMKESLDSISDKYVVRNIYLERDGQISQPNQTVEVTIPVPDDWIPDFCKLYWVQEDGTLKEIQAKTSFDNLVFTTDHFSYYAIVYDDSISVTDITLNKDKLSLDVGEKEILTATITPYNATNKTVMWKSSNTKVATVVNGEVTAVGVGSAVITATTVDGKSAICKVTVKSNTAPGDTNNDGEVNIADALMISRYDAGLAELDESQLAVSDVNNDGEVNIADALMISRFDAGLINEL